MRTLRLLAFGWLMHFRMLSQSWFDGFLAILWPLFFATVTFFMFRSGRGEAALEPVALGAAVMGVWTATSVSASSALQRERRMGTLELLVASPTNLAVVLLPVTLATSTIGLYCIVATLLWARFPFGIHVPIVHPLAFALGVVGIVVTIGSLGFLMAVAFVRSRRAWAIGAVTEYPIWLICGFLVPISAIEAARLVARGASLDAVSGLLAKEATIGIVYSGLGLGLIRYFELQGRRLATLERV